LKERDYVEDLDVKGLKILKCIFKNLDGAWYGFIWLRTGTGGLLLWKR